MANSSSPVVAGVLSIVSGVFGLMTGAGMILLAIFFNYIESYPVNIPHDFSFVFLEVVSLAWGIILIMLAIPAIVGGIYALQRRRWGLALAGSIASILVFFPMGVAAIIFVGLSRTEFQ